ncbi:PadR family transcriptional regulator [Microbacterium sp. STN6]|uniref:PadR family transcriptional regulator n=1 Tax=Microbacterium sp. STN6 TaxID=2995588 RepID=UPI002260E592|nr:PadR family transcriptional regulator [Microbacterium sp. STN6]MCX7522985.1 PadR family transcriptional regulator [Microbacterium sp. STN6]
MTPVFAHGNLRLYLLSLLAESPRHGYELIQALSERFGGTYSPSAGTIYPRLAKLEEEGLVTKAKAGRKSVYEITDAGRAELADREDELDAIEDEVTDSVRRLADEVRAGVNEAMKSLRAELASAARDAKRDAKRGDRPGSAGFESGSGPTTGPRAGGDPRTASRLALHEADLLLNEFRQQVRSDLREQAARAELPASVVSQLRHQLAQVRADVLGTIAGLGH